MMPHDLKSSCVKLNIFLYTYPVLEVIFRVIWELLSSVRAGIKMSEIFKAFLENEKAIRRYISRFCQRKQDIEDFTQETFLKGFAAEMRSEIREPKAYLFRIAKNVVLADIRKNKRKPTGFLEDSGGADIIIDEDQLAADDLMDGRRKLVVFARAVANLSPRCRKAFLMRRVDGLQYKQIANRMGISVSAVEKHVTTGLLKCNAYLRAHGYASSEFGGANNRSLKTRDSQYDIVQTVKQDEQD